MTDFNGFVGMARRLDDIDLPRIGATIGVGEDELHAFLEVEAAGKGFDAKGRPKMLFEPHVFYKQLSGDLRQSAVDDGLAYQKWGTEPYPKDSYPRLLKAMELNETAALRSASWGLTQILGLNHATVGYATVQQMVLAFMDDEETHVEAMVCFLVANGIDDDLRAHRWAEVARVYNGPGYKKNRYDTRMAAAYAKWAKIKDTPWTPSDEPVGVSPTVSLYDGHPHREIEAVQRRLDELGYPEVGGFDGRWGTKTRAAILSFRADNGLPLVPEINNDLMAALMVARPRQIAPERSEATMKDLRETGASDVRAADSAQTAGAVTVGGGILSASGDVLEKAEEYGGLWGRVAAVIEPFQEFVADNFWILVVAVGAFIIWKSGVLKRIRLEKHQTGKDVSE